MTKIYFIPGTMCDQRLWSDTWEHLSTLVHDDIQCIHLNIPALATVHEIAQQLPEQMDEQSYVVGFSLGGYLASEIAIKFPEKVSKLLLVSNMSSALPEAENKERLRIIQWITANGYNGIADKRIEELISPVAHTNQKIKHVIQAMDATLGQQVLLHQLKVTTLRENLLPQLMTLHCPIKFCIGDTDCLVKTSRIQAHIAQSTLANKTLQILKNTGHMLPLEQPEQLANTIADYFFEKHVI